MPGGAPADDAGGGVAGGGAAGAAMPVQFGQLSKAEMLAIVKEQVRQGMCDKMTVLNDCLVTYKKYCDQVALSHWVGGTS